ncbi:MAG: ankyrin repeat domain-containing protein [Desulfomonile tiedjei]|nr:ankyrin repeat domain-containing protein [Desulfomonile tiedjei]
MSLQRGRVLRLGGAILALGLSLMLAASHGIAGADDRNQQLFQAVVTGDLGQVKTLLKSGADVNAMDKDGFTPLEIAQHKGHKEIEHFLRDLGVDTAEGLRMARYGDRVARRGAEVFFRMMDGTIVSRRSTPPAQQDGYTDSTGEVRVGHAFTDFIDPWYVIHEQYFEGDGFKFFNRDTGAVAGVRGAGPFSPDKTRFLSIGYPGESPCDTEIWTLSSKGIAREWRLEGYCFNSYQWSDSSTVEVLAQGDIVARIKHDGSGWTCGGSSEVCQKGASAPSSEGGADSKLSGPYRTPLMEAAAAGDAGTIDALLDGGADVNELIEYQGTALEQAAEAGHLDVVKVLLDRGAKVNAEDTSYWPALTWAASRRNWDVVKLLLERGAEMDAEFGWLALMKAAEDGHQELVTSLLDRGVPINPEKGPTALMYAAGEGRVDMVKLLLEKAADVNAKDEHGRTALMLAAIRKHAEIVRLLLDKGAAVNAQDEDGFTALMDAAWGGNPEAVRIILDEGADVDAKNRRGETALKIAQVCGHRKIVGLLNAR